MPEPGENRGPLAGVRVLDFSRIFAGPLCTMLLGDLGADVVKIERPGDGDDTRGWGPPFLGGESAYFLCLNRNKRSVTLNLADERGVAIARSLAREADVLVENFRVGWMAARGLDYATLADDNPRVVYASVTGYGQTGPASPLAGYDFLAQARGGLMAITGDPSGPPMKVGVAASDLIAGLYGATSILAALRARDTTGCGQHVDISLLDCTVASLANYAGNCLAHQALGETPPDPPRMGNAHPNIVPYQLFAASDGDFVLACGNDAQFRRVAALLGHPEWADDARFATNAARVRHREALIPLMAPLFDARPAAHWIEALRRLGVPTERVQNVAQTLADEQVAARGMLTEVEHPTAGALRLVGPPVQLSATPASVRRPPPLLGQHTAEVLRERLGLTDAEIRALASGGII